MENINEKSKLNDDNEVKNEQVKEEDLQKQEDMEFEGVPEEKDEDKIKDKVIEELEMRKKQLIDENDKIKNELEAMKDRLARTVAEYDNYRKRTAKEKEGIYTDACEDVLKEMLPVLDNLERAILAEGNVDALKSGVEMTVKQFKGSLEKLQVEEIPTEDGFDPNFHNAVMHIDDNSFGENEVVEVLQKGYKRADKVIRYSMVKVAN